MIPPRLGVAAAGVVATGVVGLTTLGVVFVVVPPQADMTREIQIRPINRKKQLAINFFNLSSFITFEQLIGVNGILPSLKFVHRIPMAVYSGS